MAFPLAIPGALALGSAAINLARSFNYPEYPLNYEDVNKLINREMNEELARVASDIRRRFIGAGQEGSGTINTAIQDAQSRVRTFYEQQRQKALQLLSQGQYQRNVAAYNQAGQTLGDLTNIGFSAFTLGGGFGGGGSNLSGMAPELQTYINMLSSGASPQVATLGSQPVDALQPRGLGVPQMPQFTQPLQYAR